MKREEGGALLHASCQDRAFHCLWEGVPFAWLFLEEKPRERMFGPTTASVSRQEEQGEGADSLWTDVLGAEFRARTTKTCRCVAGRLRVGSEECDAAVRWAQEAGSDGRIQHA